MLNEHWKSQKSQVHLFTLFPNSRTYICVCRYEIICTKQMHLKHGLFRHVKYVTLSAYSVYYLKKQTNKSREWKCWSSCEILFGVSFYWLGAFAASEMQVLENEVKSDLVWVFKPLSTSKYYGTNNFLSKFAFVFVWFSWW